MRSFTGKRLFWLVAALVALSIGLAPVARADTPRYTLLDLGQVEADPPQGKGNGPRGINSGGQVAAFLSPSGGQWRGFLWSDEAGPVDLGSLGSSTTTLAYAINANGWIVGESNHTAFAWDSTHTLQSLGALSGATESHAYGVSDVGQVVGSSRTRRGILHAVIWDRARGMVDLGISGEARGINNLGQICGTGTFLHTDAYFWRPTVPHGTTGRYIDCGNLGVSSSATAINDNGTLVGSSVRTDGTTHAFQWTSQTGIQDLGTLSGQPNSWATAINSQGTVVGYSGTDAYHAHPVLWSPSGQILDLTTVLSTGGINDAVSLVQATGINASGWITGIGFYNRGWHGFVLQPSSITQVAGDRITFRSLPGQDVWGSSPTQKTTSNVHTIYFPSSPLTIGGPLNIGPVYFNAQASGQVRADFIGSEGGLNVAMPATIKLQFPDAQHIQPNDDIVISSSYYPWPSSAINVRSTNFRVTLKDNSSAALNLGIHLPDILGGDISLIDYNVTDNQTFFDSNDYVNKPFEISNFLEGNFHFPNLATSGGIVDPVPTPLGEMTASASDTFFDLRFRVSSFLADFVGIPLSIHFEASALGADCGLDADFLQFNLTGGVGLTQYYTFDPRPLVTLNFSQPVQVWSGGQLGSPQSSVTFAAGDSVRLRMPGGTDPVLAVKPAFALDNTFNNSTHLFLSTGTEFQLLDFSAYAHAFGGTVFQLSFATPVQKSTLATVDLGEIYHPQFTLQFPQIQSPQFRIVTARHKAPQLTLATPDQVAIFTMDPTHTGPSATAFHNFVHGVTNLTIAGTGFTSKSKAQIEYYGNTTALATTFRNATQIYVSIPNALLLFPGVGRLSVLDSGNLSNSLDITFAYPTPKLTAAGPNMWASDPTPADANLSLTGTGFIGVPDYYYSPVASHPGALLQKLWAQEFPTAQALPALLPDFPYFDTDGNGVALSSPLPAPMPTIFWNNQLFSLFSADSSGALTPTLLPGSLYAQSQLASVYIENPIPGGGISNMVPARIAAPNPTIKALAPSSVLQGTSDFMLVVTGISNISAAAPHDLTRAASGFVANSKVYWNGNARPTTFVSPTELHASISAADVLASGNASVTVGNPYVAADGTTGTYTSSPVTFGIVYPAPTISSLSPSGTFPGDPSFNPGTSGNPATYLKVNGSGFAPNSVVYWNGAARVTQYVSPSVVLATILPADVATAGTFPVFVVNPSTGAQSSSVNFVVGPQVPVIKAISPNTALVGASDTTLDILGTGFSQKASVQWNGVALPTTTYLSSTHLSAVIPAANLTAAGIEPITVLNVDTGTTSAPFTFTVGTSGIQSITISPSPILGGTSATGTITLLVAPTANQTFTLQSTSTALTIPTNVSVKKGAKSATFPVATTVVVSDTVCDITASLGTEVNSTVVTVQALTLSSLRLASSSVKGGTQATGTVTLNGVSNGQVGVIITSDSPYAQPQTAFLTIPKGKSSASFTLNTFPVTASTTANITAGIGSVKQTVALTITP